MDSSNFSSKVVIDNEDSSYKTFVKLITKCGVLSKKTNELRCHQAPRVMTLANKYKKSEIQYSPFEGEYEFEFKQTLFKIVLKRGNPLILTECRQLEYEKSATVYGPNIEKVKEFIKYVFDLLEEDTDENKIIIYENQNGYWQQSKEKIPRKLQSVIFRQQFISGVVNDIKDFIDSEEWYAQMGIPYKKSYLLYGPPGTGKSSFAQALAGAIKFSICFVNCSDKINDFNFNSLLNRAPKKSIILIEDVDSIFSERKNLEKNNALTFSGFLNAIDGVRSQEGRIIIMTTNYKERLDPALLRPGRVDEMFQISYATHYQIQKLCYRFYKQEALAKKFAQKIPEYKFSMSQIQGYFLKYRRNPELILERSDQILNSDENVPISQFLSEINCHQCINDFKIQEVYTLSSAKNLPKQTVQKIASKLNSFLKGRLIQVIRMDRKNYIKSSEAIQKFIEQSIQDQAIQRKVLKHHNENPIKTTYTVRDLVKQFTQQSAKQEKQSKQVENV